MLPDKVLKGIEFELDELEHLFDLYRRELFDLDREPNLAEILSFIEKFGSNDTTPGKN